MKTILDEILYPDTLFLLMRDHKIKNPELYVHLYTEPYYDKIIYDTYSLEEFEKYEVKIDPFIFPAFIDCWAPKSQNQQKLLDCFLDAKRNDRLHTFTCMCLDPSFSIRDDEEVPIPPKCFQHNSTEYASLSSIKQLIFVKDTLPGINISPQDWISLFKSFNPHRNSRLMSRTEYICKCIYIILKLMDLGWRVEHAFEAVCDDSQAIGNYKPYWSDLVNLTGSYEEAGFYDLVNTSKILAPDPWEKSSDIIPFCDGFQAGVEKLTTPNPWDNNFSIFPNYYYIASGHIGDFSNNHPVSSMWVYNSKSIRHIHYSVGVLAMD